MYLDHIRCIRNLAAAMVMQAVVDSQTSKQIEEPYRNSAKYWLYESKDTGPLSLHWCATVLEVDPGDLRRCRMGDLNVHYR